VDVVTGLTRDEFLDRFIAMSGLPASVRTPSGIKDGAFEREAVPCDCGHHECLGWQLVKLEKASPVMTRLFGHSGGFASGGWVVQRERLAMIHHQETILPRCLADQVRDRQRQSTPPVWETTVNV
jgi:CubicO group peptidase (beta-lactamase class C family)